LGTLTLDCDVSVESNITVAVLGPNGAGKTTLLRIVAGLARLDEGHIDVNGSVFDDTGTHTWLTPEARQVGFVFQDHGLFPHLSVLDNVAFGLRARGVDRRTAQAKANAWLERVDLMKYASSRPSELSGGQSQRAALARVLVTDPQALLLDEPLAAVDASARLELRRALREHLSTFAGVRLIVTHDPLEAASLADRVIVLEDGHVTQDGSFAEVSNRPRSAWIARMVGLNLLRGVVSSDLPRNADTRRRIHAHGRDRRAGSGAGNHPAACGRAVSNGSGGESAQRAAMRSRRRRPGGRSLADPPHRSISVGCGGDTGCSIGSAPCGGRRGLRGGQGDRGRRLFGLTRP
jgi:ABC-type sulfate/molybdate transport systems ATPase subunit